MSILRVLKEPELCLKLRDGIQLGIGLGLAPVHILIYGLHALRRMGDVGTLELYLIVHRRYAVLNGLDGKPSVGGLISQTVKPRLYLRKLS